MRRIGTQLFPLLLVVALTAAACGGDRDSSTEQSRDDDQGQASERAEPEADAADSAAASAADAPADGDSAAEAADAAGAGGADGAPDPETAETAEPDADAAEPQPAPAPDVVMFGDLPSPCGPGDASGATDRGVTDGAIQIGTADDRGFVGAPGLNRDMGDTMKAIVEWCNQQGGINGRQIALNLYDSAILAAATAQIESCEAGDFMMVGEGMTFDNLSLPERIACDMAHVPAWTVSADAAHGPRMIQPLPNPVDAVPMSQSAQLARLYPDLIGNVGVMLGNFDATRVSAAKIRAASEAFGYSFPDDIYLEYNINGEEDWSPFVNLLKGAGAGLVYFSGACPNFFLNFMLQASVQDYAPVTFADGNFLSEECAAANTDGAMDNLYVRSAVVPFSEREHSPAIDDYLTIVEELGTGEVSGISLQSASAFLLWSTAARDCGSALTDDCILETIAGYETWTGHGLHAATNPASNLPTSCGALFRLEGTEYVRVTPTEPAGYDCSDDYLVFADTPFLEAANLDENRVTQNVG